MKQQLNNKKRGFTIIEVVLVLAIAALIFLLVFLAFPALQRNQRDTQRRNDLGRFVSQMSQYQTNNNGQVADESESATDAFVSEYLLGGENTWLDPTGENVETYGGKEGYNVGNNRSNQNLENNIGFVGYDKEVVCGEGGTTTTDGAGTRTFAVRIALEAGGVYCQDNN